MDSILELFFSAALAFFGAMVGILYPPRTPGWARAQKVGIGLLCGAVIAWAAAFWLSRPAASWTAILLGTVLFVAFLAVGNVCRKRHENYSN